MIEERQPQLARIASIHKSPSRGVAVTKDRIAGTVPCAARSRLKNWKTDEFDRLVVHNSPADEGDDDQHVEVEITGRFNML